ncbi:uncharacterized protein [Amphiura filiformis]|uniref:uncharacterized protein isoform X1 n=1 Tax=Amphiura filiformis TaxID=82378 RepID=UPI003B2170AC
MDIPGKRRSLPPLNNSDGDLPSPTKKKTRKKRTPTGTTDASDSQQSGGVGKHQNMDGMNGRGINGSTENLVPDKMLQTKKTKKKKRKSAALTIENGGDDTAVDGDAEGEGASVANRKPSPGVTRRKREHRQSRIPRSISDEVLQNLEPPPLPPPQSLNTTSAKKKGRRPQSKMYADDGMEGDGPLGRPPPGSGRQRKKKKMARMPTSGDENYHADGEAMSVDMMLAAEDIITGDKQADEDEETQQQQQQASQVTVLPSQPVERLFMERKSGFTSEDKGRLAKRREKEQQRQQQPEVESDITTTQAAVSTHRTFLTFGLFCHGLLAGFALWQCVIVYMLSDPIPLSDKTGDQQFLEQYSRMGQPALSMYYFLLAICTVSVFDRFDIARPDRQFFRGLLTFQSGAVSILIYLISLIFSVSIAAIDDKISLYFKTHPTYCEEDCPNGGTLWEDTGTIAQQLKIWRIINLIRAIGAVLGWLVLSLAPTTDFTSEHLHDADEPLWDEQQDLELNNMHHTSP